MKLGTDRHPKFLKFATAMNTSRAATVGMLELLWHTTAEFAPQGDIGKFDNQAIAVAVGWEGEADHLVGSLVAAGWLDPCSDHRLVVHNWEKHAPEFLKKRLSRTKTPFITPKTPSVQTTADNGGQCPDMSGQRLPTVPCRAVPNRAVPCPTEPTDTAAAPTSPPPAVAWDGKAFAVDPEVKEAWRSAYPAVDIDGEILRAAEWAVSNPAKRKKNWRSFLTRWLAKEQERGAPASSKGAYTPAKPATGTKYAGIGHDFTHYWDEHPEERPHGV